jgi:hypothetical protein
MNTEPILLIEGIEVTLSEFLAVPENQESLAEEQIEDIKNLRVGETWFGGLGADVKRIA